jgi:mono/diheme cytochrome c family protein
MIFNPMNLFRDFSSSWANPQLRHALMVHWPVVLSVLSALFVLILAINRGKSASLRTICLLLCLGFMVLGYITMQSGSNAENAAGPRSAEADKVLHDHEELGEKVPVFGAVCAGLMILTFIPKTGIRIGAAWLGVVACGVSAAWLAQTAHLGGLLVYTHGVGTPQSMNVITSQPADRTASASRTSLAHSEVWPILESHCIKCHNPDRVARGKSGKLDQTSLETLLQGGRSGPAIVPGKPEESLLIKRVRGEIPDADTMPPPPNEGLTAEEIAALENWIRAGANAQATNASR